MRISKIIPLTLIGFTVFAMLSLQYSVPSKAETNTFVSIGPWILDLNAFADKATDISDGPLYGFRAGGDGLSSECDLDPTQEECLDEALTNYSPNTFLENVGNIVETNYSNHFQLDFTDIKAENSIGPEIVFFDCRFLPNSYDIALRQEGGSVTDFITFDAGDFIETEVTCDSPFNIWGVEIEFADFFTDPTGIVVDALQFKSLSPGGTAPPEGDPAMVAVITKLPFSISLPIIFRP